MEITLLVIFFLFGAAVGSFLGACTDRLPRGDSVVYPPFSYCDTCRHRLSWRDLIPLVSYLWLRGRCRYCRAPIPGRVFWIEVLTALFFAVAFWYYGISTKLAVLLIYFCLFLVIAIIDLEHRLVLNKLVYPAAGVALVINIFLPETGALKSAIGGAIGFTILLIPALVSRGGMGWGDVKLAGLIGLVTGFPHVLVALLMGIVLGGLAAALLLLLGIKKRKETIPFAPFLSVSTIATLLWGSQLVDSYMRLIAGG